MKIQNIFKKIIEKFQKYLVVIPLPVTTYRTQYLDPFMNWSWDFSKQAPILISVYGDTFGGHNGNIIVTGSWFLTIIALYWIRHEDIAIPMIMTTILANIAFWVPGVVPDEWKVGIAIACVLIPLAGIGYAYWTDR